MKNIYLKVPSIDELHYRKKWMMDKETMSYNAGYDIDIEGYDKNTGIIIKTDEEMNSWYNNWINKEPDKNFAYIYYSEIDEPIGEVYYYLDNNTYSMGILIKNEYRGNGYSYQALVELEKIAFEKNNINELTDIFPEDRVSAIKVFKKAGFIINKDKVEKRFNKDIIVKELLLTKDMYFNDKIEKYNNIKTPEYLYEFMESYIKYGLKIDNKLYEWGRDEFQKACEEKWRLRNDLDIIKSGYGHCFDQTELEKYWFKKHGYEYKTLFIIFLLDYDNHYVCHTYLIYKDKNKWCWFEHADCKNKGIHKFNTMKEAILAQREKHIEFNKILNLPMNKEIIDTIHIYEYQSPKIGSTNQEFLDNIFNNAKDITKKIIKKS